MSTFGPTKDAYVDNVNASTNHGTGSLAMQAPTGKAGAILRPLLSFDVSSLAGATVTAATLTIDVQGTSGSAAAAHLYRVTQAWVEASATWNTYDGTHSWATAGGDYTTTGGVGFTAPGSVGSFTVSGLAALVQDAIDNRAGLFDLLLRYDTEAPASLSAITFSARDGTTPPVLSVTSTGGGAGPTGVRRRGGVV